jgi:hypothetical protein
MFLPIDREDKMKIDGRTLSKIETAIMMPSVIISMPIMAVVIMLVVLAAIPIAINYIPIKIYRHIRGIK